MHGSHVRQVIRHIHLFSNNLLIFTLKSPKYSTPVFVKVLVKSILNSGKSAMSGDSTLCDDILQGTQLALICVSLFLAPKD